MRRLSWIVSMLALAVSASPILADEVSVRLAEAPAPPSYRFTRPPELSMVAGSQVYVVDDRRVADDGFRYGVFWYVYRGGWWYRARTWNGPYVAIQPRDVPRAIITVPPGRWKHRPESAAVTVRRNSPPAWVAEKERRIHRGR